MCHNWSDRGRAYVRRRLSIATTPLHIATRIGERRAGRRRQLYCILRQHHDNSERGARRWWQQRRAAAMVHALMEPVPSTPPLHRHHSHHLRHHYHEHDHHHHLPPPAYLHLPPLTYYLVPYPQMVHSVRRRLNIDLHVFDPARTQPAASRGTKSVGGRWYALYIGVSGSEMVSNLGWPSSILQPIKPYPRTTRRQRIRAVGFRGVTSSRITMGTMMRRATTMSLEKRSFATRMMSRVTIPHCYSRRAKSPSERALLPNRSKSADITTLNSISPWVCRNRDEPGMIVKAVLGRQAPKHTCTKYDLTMRTKALGDHGVKVTIQRTCR